MPAPAAIKFTHKAIQTYYATLQSYSAHRVSHEGAVSVAFQNLLGETAKTRGWTLVAPATNQSRRQDRGARWHGVRQITACTAATGKQRTRMTPSTRKSPRRSRKATR